MMKSIFRVVFYLRSNYVNKEGKTSVMLRIYLNNERLSLGSTGISVKSSQWDKEKERIKGRTTEALNTNLQLDNIASGLQSIFRRIEMSDVVSLERIKSEFLGKKEEIDTLMQLFEKHNGDVAKQVGVSVLKTKVPKRLNKSLRGFFSLSLRRAGDQKKRSKRKSLNFWQKTFKNIRSFQVGILSMLSFFLFVRFYDYLECLVCYLRCILYVL